MSEYENAPFLWETLKNNGDEVLLYGVGDGADKILDMCESYSIKCVGVFASDSFAAGKIFRGYTVLHRTEALRAYPDAVILLCFAVFRSEDLADITQLACRRRLYAPDVPVTGKGIVTPEELINRSYDIKKARKAFADDKSREIFDKILCYKLSGDISYLRQTETDRASDLKELFKIPENGVYVDLGAYRGDTIEEYISLFGEPRCVYAFEPASVNYRKLCEAFGGMGWNLTEAASWNENGEISFSDKSGRGAKIGGKRTVKCLTLDSVIKNTKIDYLKIDVEGAELETLQGAYNTIINSKPHISLSAYHKTWDMADLCIYIKSLSAEYDIYLRHHPYIPAWDIMLYCVPKT